MSERVFHPARLRHARKLRGLRQNELAQTVHVTPAAVSQYESGAARPRSEIVARIAMALGCAPEWFYRQPVMHTSTSAFFRSLRSVPQRERDRAEAYAKALIELVALLEEEVQLPEPAFPTPAQAAPTAQLEEIEHAAIRLRAAWGVPPGPVAHVVRLLELHGAVVAAVGAFDERMDAFSVRSSGPRPVVVLCSDRGAAARRRFDAAHELGHLVLHDSATHEHWQERQAHAFAATLLMPREEVEPWLPRRSNDFEVLAEGSRVWGVSMQALLYRGRELGTLSESSYLRAMRKLSAAGWRTSEPVALGPPETPSLLAKALDAFVGAGGTPAQLAERFGIPQGRLLRMLSLPEEREAHPPAQVVTLPGARSA